MANVTVERFATLAETTTTADPGSGGTSLAVTTRTPFPQTGQFRILVQNSETDKTNRELMLVTGGLGTGAGSFTVTRGIEGTTGVAHTIGSYVAQIQTAGATERWVPSYLWQPRHQHILGWSFDPFVVWSSSGMTPTAGIAYYTKVAVPESISVTNVIIGLTTAGVTLTNCYAGLFSTSTGGTGTATRLGVTADQSAVWTTDGWKTMALTGGPFAVTGGPDEFVYVGLLVATWGTAPTFLRGNALGSNLKTDLGMVAADGFRQGTLGSSLTALPTSFAINGMAAQNQFVFAGLS